MSTNMSINHPESITEEKIIEALKQFGEGATVRELRGITNEEMEAIYAMGVNFYRAGNYEDAEKVFKFLVIFDHLSSRYWTAMGSLRQVQRQFEKAVEAYRFASFLDLHNPKPAYYAAECFVALGRKQEALNVLDVLEQYTSKDDEKGRTYLAKGRLLKAKLEK